MLESEIGRQKDEIASLKQQLADSQSIERERKKLSDKVEKLESKVSLCSAVQVGERTELITGLSIIDGGYDSRQGRSQRS